MVYAATLSSLSTPRMTSASSGKGSCNALASSHGASIQTSRSSFVIRIADIAFGCIGSTMAFGAVEDRSQTNVRERLSATPRSKNIAVLRSAARSGLATAGTAAGEAGAGEAKGPRPGWADGWI
jgi:hypothetical protein